MQYIEAPFEYTGGMPSVFLAGGITGAPPWQNQLAAMLCDTQWAVINPRREHYPDGDPTAEREQIAWEYRHLEGASMIAFWFSAKALCPITLFELGTAMWMSKKIIVGAHPSYMRRQNIEAQLRLRRPEVRLVETLGQLAGRITDAYPTLGTPPQTHAQEATQCVP